MTLAPPESSEPDGAELRPEVEPVIRPVVRQRSAHQRRRRKRVVVAQAAVTALFALALVALGWVGWNTALRITGGSVDEVTDPDAPGYVAAVKPTSVTLVGFTGEPVLAPTTTTSTGDATGDGVPAAEAAPTGEAAPTTGGTVPSLATMLLVIERSGGDRTLVPIPANTTLWDFEGSGPQSAASVFESGGIDVLRLRLGADLSFGSTRALTAPVSVLGDLAGAVGPITVALPDDVLEGTSSEDATVRYAAGQLTLEPDQVPEFMSFLGWGESESNRALRQELVWEALVAAAGDGVQLEVEGDDGDEVAEVLGSALDESTRFDVVPMLAVPLNVSPPVTLYRIDQMAMPSWVPGEVPFPVAAFPGQRARVELLNGTADDGVLQVVSPEIVGANGEIAFTGNAESFEVAESRVEYATEEAAAAAQRIAEALGLTATLNEDLERAVDVDVVVVVGADRLAQG